MIFSPRFKISPTIVAGYVYGVDPVGGFLTRFAAGEGEPSACVVAGVIAFRFGGMMIGYYSMLE